MEDSVDFSIIVSADAEWAAIKPLFTNIRLEHSPYGEFFHTTIESRRILVFQGGWGKVAVPPRPNTSWTGLNRGI